MIDFFCVAYIDPGTGSFIIQVVVALVAASLFGLKMFWRRIVGLFAGKKHGDAGPDHD